MHKTVADRIERWLGGFAQTPEWSFCVKAASMAAEQEMR
jgi:hypothetical protein